MEEWADEAAHRQSDNLVAFGRHLFHFHTAQGSDEEYLGIGLRLADGIGY